LNQKEDYEQDDVITFKGFKLMGFIAGSG
jgi:hypothetical protein